MRRWLARLRHDLVKRALVPARDLRELGPGATAADVAALARGLLALVDDEGRPISACALWRALRAEIADAPAGALDDFQRAVDEAEAAARALPAHAGAAVDAALALEPAFERLARALDAASRAEGD
jgi:hypothetical protein